MKTPAQTIRKAISGSTLEASAIEDSLRLRIQESLGVSLKHVRIHRDEESLAANRALGSLAFAVDGHICLRPGFDASLGPMYSYVLAHELVHVAQKQKGKACAAPSTAPSVARVEAEANEIAFQILAGKTVSRITPDPSPDPSCWGPAGHYWTVYFASMAAGLDKQEAKDNAFFAQMPDQVDELDATDEGEGFYPNYLGFVIPGDGTANRLLRRIAVQKGLHALTGWSAENETTYRTNILKTTKPGTFEFALALHPFGDSFAHRIVNGGARMYSGPAGHAVEVHASDCAGVVNSGNLKSACFENAYAVDNLSRRSDLYQRYGLAMYDLLVAKWATTPAIPRDRVASHLDEISDEGTENEQIMKILTITAGETGELHGDYDPNAEPCLPWKKFHANHPWVSPDTLDRALRCAADWSGSY
jgi:Domain of unknown function (DUF4157)